MRKQKTLLYMMILLMAAAMLAAVAISVKFQPEKPLMERITFQDTATGIQLKPVYENVSQRYVLYLPAHSSPDQIRMSLLGNLVKASGEDGTQSRGTLKGMPLGEEILLTARSLLGSETEELELQHCTGLPTLFIQVEKDTREYIHENKENQEDALVMLAGEDGKLEFSQACTLTGRGNSSWDGQSKRPYELDFDSAVSFGPFENVSRLCLLAEHSDESKLRNSVAYYGSALLGIPYASQYQYANVYFGGEYLGIYGIATKENYRSHIAADGIQAVFEITSNAEKQAFHPELTRNPVRVLYGSELAVEAAVRAMEQSLLREDWEECQIRIDSGSFARKIIAEELFGNSDVTFASQYFYLAADGRIHCMLPWDYDLSMGYAFRYYNNKQVYELETYKDPNAWYARLLAMEPFRDQVVNLMDTLCTPEYLAALQTHMEDTARIIGVSRLCDILRWRGEKPFNWYDLSCGEETLEGMAALYSRNLFERAEYLRKCMADWDNYCLVAFDGEQYGNLFIPRGANLWDYLQDAAILQGEKIDGSFEGWYTDDGVTPEEVTIVTEDLMFHALYG